MEFIDSHTHLYDSAYGDAQGQDEAVRRAIEAGVGRMIIPDVNSRDRVQVLELCKRWPGVAFPCMGLHPTDIAEDWQRELYTLEQDLGKAASKIVAIGETGLDYHYGADSKLQQLEAFRTQIEFALKYGLPLIIHSREATLDTFKTLEDFKGKGLRGVFHAYSGSLETWREMHKYGDWYVGIGGVLTFKKASIASFVSEIPLERILLETDSPYLTPVPHRGERNESAYIPIIAEFLAERHGCSVEKVAEITTRNAEILFNL